MNKHIRKGKMNIKDSNQQSEELRAVVGKIMAQQTQEAQELKAKVADLVAKVNAMSPEELQAKFNAHFGGNRA